MTDNPRQHPATAHLPVAGCGKDCAGCVHFRATSKKAKGRCWQWAQFMGLAYRYEPEFRKQDNGWWRGLPTILRDTAACKYFAPRSAA